MNINRTYKILMATGIPVIDQGVGSIDQCEVVKICQRREDLYLDVSSSTPQIIIASDQLGGHDNLPELLTNIKKEKHYTRIIYLAGKVDPRNQERIDELGRMVLTGIYDLYVSDEISFEIIEKLIKEPMAEESVSYLAKNIINNQEEEIILKGIPVVQNNLVGTMNNVFVFTSIKPGTGKSFLSVNTACAVAAYGKLKSNGEKPKVALIEADLQTLSIGTILDIKENKKKNMKTAMEAISTIFDRGNMIGDESTVGIVNKVIDDCMVPYEKVDNLRVLTGSTLTPEEIDSLRISPEYYIYLLEHVSKNYDIVIIDTNSSMFHVTTYPILQKAESCFYIINLDINNVRNNLRYLGVLKKLGLTGKIKWVLNENIENSKDFKSQGTDIEKLHFTADQLVDDYGMELIAKIPAMEKTIFLNRVYEGTPVVLDGDEKIKTKPAKIALLSLANIIWPTSAEIERVMNLKEKKGGLFSFLSSGSKEKKPPKEKSLQKKSQQKRKEKNRMKQRR